MRISDWSSDVCSSDLDTAAAVLDAAQQRSVGDAGRGEDDVALRQIAQIIDAVEVLDSPFARARALGVVAENKAALELAADAAQRRGGEPALRRAARSHIDVDIGLDRKGTRLNSSH